jgi:hypothetical protein
MGIIQTNYNSPAKLVLMTNEGAIAAIINVPIGADITEQVKLAVKDELNANDVVFQTDFIFDEFQTIKSIQFIYGDENDEEYCLTFKLVKTQEY